MEDKKLKNAHFTLIEGYELFTVSARKLDKDEFINSMELTAEQKKELVAKGREALKNNGQILGYRQKKRVVSIFIVDKKSDSFECNNAYISDKITDDKKAGMINDIKRNIALASHTAGFNKGSYYGEPVPKIIKKRNSYAPILALVIAFGFGGTMGPATHSIPIAICFGMSQFALWYSILANSYYLEE